MAEIDFFYQNFWKYWNGALYLVPYLGCMVYLVYKKDKKLMELFVWPFLILLATVYNPFLMRPIIEKMGWEDRYMRFTGCFRRNFCVPIAGASCESQSKERSAVRRRGGGAWHRVLVREQSGKVHSG